MTVNSSCPLAAVGMEAALRSDSMALLGASVHCYDGQDAGL